MAGSAPPPPPPSSELSKSKRRRKFCSPWYMYLKSRIRCVCKRFARKVQYSSAAKHKHYTLFQQHPSGFVGSLLLFLTCSRRMALCLRPIGTHTPLSFKCNCGPIVIWTPKFSAELGSLEQALGQLTGVKSFMLLAGSSSQRGKKNPNFIFKPFMGLCRCCILTDSVNWNIL